jgi:hypothetical protein
MTEIETWKISIEFDCLSVCSGFRRRHHHHHPRLADVDGHRLGDDPSKAKQ